MKKHYIKKVVSYSMVGSLGFTIVASLQGCDNNSNEPPINNQNQNTLQSATEQGRFMVIQQTGSNPDTYELIEEYPADSGSRAILKDLDGNERVLTESELRQIAEAEAQRVEAGDSQLTRPVAENQGLSLGETILASAAGALIGGMLANRLMNNQNFRQHQQAQAQRVQRTMNSTRNPSQNRSSTQNRNQPRSGFFGNNSRNSSSSGSRSFGS